jgi:excisionase family DNA binding protein
VEASTLAKLAAQVEQNLTVAQAAAVVGCSAATVQRAVLRGDLPGVRIGRDVWLEPAAVTRWARSRDRRS